MASRPVVAPRPPPPLTHLPVQGSKATAPQPPTAQPPSAPVQSLKTTAPQQQQPAGVVATRPTAQLDGPAKVQFLLEVAQRLEAEGNPVEAVKSLETALLLRRSLDDRVQSLFAQPLAKQAQSLVMKCNQLGVDKFQTNDYDSAQFFLDKALFLTDDASATNCFAYQDHDRLRLRASTFNNFGCLERRRGALQPALTYLQRAVEVEAMVDPGLGASASTNLNLCTVLNKLGHHDQAVVAAERSVRALRVQAQAGSDDRSTQFVQMTISAYYNLGVSCEYTGKPKDNQKAADAYANCIVAGFKLANLTAADSPVIAAAEKALTRLGQPLPITAVAPQQQRAPSTAQGLRPALDLAGALTSSRPVPPTARGVPEGRPNSTNPRARIETGIMAHMARLKAKQQRQEDAKKRGELALQRAQLAHDREKAQKLRKEQELAAKERAEMAKQLYHQMEAGMRADRMRQLNDAATRIQSIWRGFLTRDYLRDRLIAAVKIQAVVRSRLCRNHLREQANAAATRALQEQRLRRQHDAARVIQKIARTMLRRLAAIQSWRCRKLRRHHSAKKIQNAYQSYRNRQQARVFARIEAERLAEERRLERLNTGARRIQRAYRAYRSRRFTRVVRMQQLRRNAAATKIQALVRGTLTRAWFRHYRVRRREQELSTAANIKRILKIQRTWRVAVAKKIRHRLYLDRRVRDRQRLLFIAARRIQCLWRSYVSRCIATQKRRVVTVRTKAANGIQRWFRMVLQRMAYIWRRNEARKLRGVKKIQRWWRDELLRRKAMETAKYHADVLRREKVRLARTYGAMMAQTAARARLSQGLVAFLAEDFGKRSVVAARIQQVCRGYQARKDVFTLKRIAFLVDERAKTKAKRNRAASIIQRAVRGYQAKDRVDLMRRRKVAAIRIQSGVRMLLAKCKLRELQRAKRDGIRDRAARKIQRSVRLFFKRRELKRLEEYYTRRRHQKLLEQRRIEASISIQSHWRGYATRQATLQARQEIMQQTVDAISIQRAYRAHLFRVRLALEFERRRRRRNRRQDAAVRIQCFWRRVLATDYAALLRERKFHRTVAAIVVQCAWRSFKARGERERRRMTRQRVRELSAAKHDVWLGLCDKINGCLKSIRAGKQRLVLLERTLQAEVDRRQRMRLSHLHASATKIQATYKGHYERCYARGVRREAREREEVLRKEILRKNRAALRIQCAFRSFVARVSTEKIRRDRAMSALAEKIQTEERAEAKSVIKQLFWAHEAATTRNFARERRARATRQDTAATTIQSLVRGFLTRRRISKRLARQKEESAIASKRAQYMREKERAAEELAAHRRAAAVKMQSLARMFIVRLRYKRAFAQLRTAKRQNALKEEKQDRAATRIQSTWRGFLARKRCERLKYQVRKEQENKVRFEAARSIQKNWRRWMAVRKVLVLRCRRDGVPVPPTRRPKQPKPPGAKRSSAGFRRSGAATPTAAN